jgi:hypothetical protein
VKAGEGVLGGGFDGDGVDLIVAESLEQGLGVATVGFVAGDVGSDGVRGKKDDLVTEGAELAGPVMGGATSLHHDGRGLEIPEVEGERRAGESLALGDHPGPMRDGDLEDVLGQIDGDGGRLHADSSFKQSV